MATRLRKILRPAALAFPQPLGEFSSSVAQRSLRSMLRSSLGAWVVSKMNQFIFSPYPLTDGRDPYDIGRDEAADFIGVAVDGVTEIFRTEVSRTTRDNRDDQDALRNKVREWLDTNRPNWSDPFLSWDN